MQLILASRSPQRRALLEQLGLPFRIVVSDFAEVEGGDPVATVTTNGRGKAEAVATGLDLGVDELVLGVDTIVAIDETILGKPAGVEQARSYLQRLNGRRHSVFSGLHLISRDAAVERVVRTDVVFRRLDDDALDAYLVAEEWPQRAGAYAIQGIGAALVESIEGDYFNVVGLPVAALVDALASLGQAPFSWL